MDKPTQEQVNEMIKAHKLWMFYAGGGKHANFTNMDLAGIDLSDCDLSFVPFTGASLSGANLKGATICGCPCSGANFVGADLENAHVSNMNMHKSTFDPIELCKARFLEGVAVASNRNYTLSIYTQAEDLDDKEVHRLLQSKSRYGEVSIRINPEQFLDLVDSGLFSP